MATAATRKALVNVVSDDEAQRRTAVLELLTDFGAGRKDYMKLRADGETSGFVITTGTAYLTDTIKLDGTPGVSFGVRHAVRFATGTQATRYLAQFPNLRNGRGERYKVETYIAHLDMTIDAIGKSMMDLADSL